MNMMVASAGATSNYEPHGSSFRNRGDARAIIDINYDYMPAGLDRSRFCCSYPHVDNAIMDIEKEELTQAMLTFFLGSRFETRKVDVSFGLLLRLRHSEQWLRQHDVQSFVRPCGLTGGLTDGAAGIGSQR